MSRLTVLACCFCLLAISAPALQAAEEPAASATQALIPASSTSVPPADSTRPGPHDAPLATSQSCEDPFSVGAVVVYPPHGNTPEAACAARCAQNGGTFHSYWYAERYVYVCYCCPA